MHPESMIVSLTVLYVVELLGSNSWTHPLVSRDCWPCGSTVPTIPGCLTHMAVIDIIAGRVHDQDDLQALIELPPPDVCALPAVPVHAGADIDVHTWGPIDLEHLCALRH